MTRSLQDTAAEITTLMKKLVCLLLILTACSRVSSSSQANLKLDLVMSVTTLTQGVQEVVCILHNQSFQVVEVKDWAAQYPSQNFELVMVSATGEKVVLPNDVPYNNNLDTNLVLRSEQTVSVPGKWRFETPPGRYSLYCVLGPKPEFRGKPVDLTLLPGLIVTHSN